MGREEDNNRVQKLIYSALCTTYQECIPLSLHCIQGSQHMINSIHSGYIERNAEAEALGMGKNLLVRIFWAILALFLPRIYRA
jgi:hypothetical protein